MSSPADNSMPMLCSTPRRAAFVERQAASLSRDLLQPEKEDREHEAERPADDRYDEVPMMPTATLRKSVDWRCLPPSSACRDEELLRDQPAAIDRDA